MLSDLLVLVFKASWQAVNQYCYAHFTDGDISVLSELPRIHGGSTGPGKMASSQANVFHC